MSVKNKCVLVISDTHFPYNHKCALKFLKAIKTKYKPDRVIHIGDEIDGHSFSFHEHNPDLLSPSDELNSAIEKLEYLYSLFPKADVLESNHGSLVYRRGVFAGLPRQVFKSYKELLNAPKGWNWHRELVITLPNKEKVYFCHGKTANHLKLSETEGMNAVQGHYHERFAINYRSSCNGDYWQMQVGCLIDDDSLAYNYNNTNIKRPILGCGLIVNSCPKLIPMLLDKNNKWSGALP